MDFLKWAKNTPLPKALKNRTGWSRLFEQYRSAIPHIHQIEPTNLCSYNCIMCPRSEEMTRSVGYMETAVYDKIISELSGYPEEIKNKDIELFHFGESLYHPDIIEMVAKASFAGLKPVLSLNPAILTEEHIKHLPRANPAKLILSLDSLDPERYKLIRGEAADLDKAMTNTEALLQQCKKYDTDIVIRMIVMDCNADEQDAFQKYWQKRDVRVELRNFFPWNKKSLQKLGSYEKYPAGMVCPFPWQYMVVHWNGDVVPCCRDHSGALVLGNVKEKSLQEIWASDDYSRFRQMMAEGRDLNPMCNECMDLYSEQSGERESE